MDELCVLGQVGILTIIGGVAFVVLGIPLFYTLITRWLTADGAPVIEGRDVAAPVQPKEVAPQPVVADSPAPAAAPAEAKVVEAVERDDLKVLPGLLAEMEAKLNSAGVRTHADLAGLDEGDVKRLGDQLSFRNGATWAAWKAAAGVVAAGGELGGEVVAEEPEVVAEEPEVVAEEPEVVVAEEPEVVVVEAEDAAAEAPAVEDASVAKRDDLKVLPGLLLETEAKLNSAGVRCYRDLASLEEVDIERLGGQLSLRNQATWAAWKREAANLLRDDLKVLPGLLVETEAKLNAAGVCSLEKVASLSDAEIGEIGEAISLRNRATWNVWRAKAAELQG